MRKTILILCCASVAVPALSADASSEFRRFMIREIPKVERAFNTRDAGYFDKIATADFTETEMGKTSTRAQAMSEMKMSMGMAKSMNAKMKLVTAHASGNTGVATTSGHFVMVMKPQNKKDKSHRMVVDMVEKETWVRSGKTWKIQKLEEANPSKMTMDGKPMDPSKMGGGG